MNGENKINYNNWFIAGTIVFILLSIVWLAVGPMYNVWSREMNGKAELAEASWNRKIAIEEAAAEKESALLKAEAEIERAKGAAESQKIISQTLTEPYLRYLWIQQMEKGENRQTIYVPTEAGLPI